MALTSIQQHVSDDIENINETIRNFQGDFAGILPSLRTLISQLANRNELTVISDLKEYGGRTSTTMQSRERHLTQQSAETSLKQNSSMHILRESSGKRCACRAHTVRKGLVNSNGYHKWGRHQSHARFSLSSVFTHHKNCLMHVFSESSRSAGLRFFYRGPWFG